MLISLVKQIKTSVLVLIILAILTGLIYPLMITGIAHLFFHKKSQGDLIEINHQLKGSRIIGQHFDDPKYFWGRPSATASFPNNAIASGASSLSPTNPILLNVVKSRIQYLQQADSSNKLLIPIDLVTASASGLDPDISPAAAYYQVHRVAQSRHLSNEKVLKLVNQFIQSRQFGIFGEARVNVLELNLALDNLK